MPTTGFIPTTRLVPTILLLSTVSQIIVNGIGSVRFIRDEHKKKGVREKGNKRAAPHLVVRNRSVLQIVDAERLRCRDGGRADEPGQRREHNNSDDVHGC